MNIQYELGRMMINYSKQCQSVIGKKYMLHTFLRTYELRELYDMETSIANAFYNTE